MPNTLYDSDLQLWIEQIIQHLHNHEFEALDQYLCQNKRLQKFWQKRQNDPYISVELTS
ncbi:hypothetical protein [Nostoc sp.]|uniref:hypothetical protein n=1 Tax=Nostoc sp. TaxID=1180 RepID=UPI002FF85F42